MNPADQWLAINAKYFPAEQIQYIRQRIEALPEAKSNCSIHLVSKTQP